MFRQSVNSDGEPIRDFYVDHEPVDLFCPPEEGMTRQEFRDECDINVLMATYERTGIVSHINPGQPQYLDVSDVPDLPKAIAIMDAAEAAFMRLPAKVRKEFDNNAVAFVEYASDPANIDRMREFGLAPPKVPEVPSNASPGSSGPSEVPSSSG